MKKKKLTLISYSTSDDPIMIKPKAFDVSDAKTAKGANSQIEKAEGGSNANSQFKKYDGFVCRDAKWKVLAPSEKNRENKIRERK